MHRRKTRQPKKKGFRVFGCSMDPSVPLVQLVSFLALALSRTLHARLLVHVSEGTECSEWREWRAAHVFVVPAHLWRKIVREVNIRRVSARIQSREQVFFLQFKNALI